MTARSAAIVLLADDLTGACDVGAQCLRNGLKTSCVFATGGAWPRFCDGGRSRVVILDTETRRMNRRAAASRVRGVARALSRIGAVPRYFKVDSTLRGNIVDEAEALRRGANRKMVWLVPANPAQGRRTRGGRQYVRGIPVERSAFARDPIHPVRTGDIPRMVRERLGPNSCARLGRRDLAAGRAHVARMRRHWIGSGAVFVVPDVEVEGDLRRIAGCIPNDDLAVGASSLARYMLPSSGRGRAGERGRTARWLGVIGSLNPVTAEQVRRASARSGIACVRLTPDGIGAGIRVVNRWAARTAPALRGNAWTLLVLDASRFRWHFGRRRSSSLAAGERIARGLARHARALAARVAPNGLLLSGGLTAATVCEEMGVRRLDLVRELSPGVVASEARSGRKRYSVITKPGGFGAPEAVARLAAKFGGG